MIKIFFLLLIAINAVYATPALNKRVMEDTFALYALDAQMRHKYHQSASFFTELYQQTSKKEYLYQSLRMLEEANDIKMISQMLGESLKHFPEDEMLQRFEIIVMLKEGKFAEASQKGEQLSEKSKEVPDYLLYAEVRLKLADYEGAIATLKKAYALNFDEVTAERISLILYAHLGQKDEAIRILKEHIGTHGNSKLIGKRLGSFYANSGAFEDAAQIYTQTYELTNDADTAHEAIKIYLYTRDYVKLVTILEKSGANDLLLLELYVKEKEFAKASTLAQKLYEREDNPLFLAQSSVFAYEGAKDKNDAAMVAKVIDGLKKATTDLDDPLYLNYLGYLMIDHNLDIGEGMGYVRRALEKQPDSPYYIDSLAWGNYKLGECVEALRLMQQVETMIGTDEQEVKEHLKAIKACKTKEKQ